SLSKHSLSPKPFPTTSLQTLGLHARSFSTATTDPPQPPPKRDFRSLAREYGPLALTVYLTMSFLTFCACFASITFLGVDQTKIRAALDSIKQTLGFHVPTPTEIAAREAESQLEQKESAKWMQYLPEWTRDPAVRVHMTNFLLAMGMTKLFMPVKLGITAAVVPGLAKKLRGMGFNLGQKGGYRAAATEVKGRAQARVEDVTERVNEIRMKRRDR
ncbi:hypothetical protein HK097_004293, partial [Rhizophlyctis rosea]